MFKMINLAGIKDADNSILQELQEAGIDVVSGEKSRTEVPYSLTGRLNGWNLSRAWYYWVVSSDTEGLPLEVATKLHNKEYLVKGEREPTTYGQVVRVAGNCECPPPEEWAFPKGEMLNEELKRLGLESINYGDLAKLCNDGVITAERFVDNYHIDSQEGLNEFARVIKSL